MPNVPISAGVGCSRHRSGLRFVLVTNAAHRCYSQLWWCDRCLNWKPAACQFHLKVSLSEEAVGQQVELLAAGVEPVDEPLADVAAQGEGVAA